MVLIADFIEQAKILGLFDFYLPFIIMFGILYAILNKSKIFGTDKLAKRVNLIVSLGASLFIMAYTPVGNITLSQFFSGFFGQVFVIILTLIGMFMIGYIVTAILPEQAKQQYKGERAFKAIAITVVLSLVLLGIYIFFSSGGASFFQPLPTVVFPGIGLSVTDLVIIFLVIITGLIIYFIGIRGEGEGKAQ
jgi:hypothetical protein